MFKKTSIAYGMIDSSSRLSLKLSCLRACEDDVARARELFDFLSEGVEALPDITPPTPSTMEVVRSGASEVFSWISEHKGDIAEGISFLRSLRSTGTLPDLSGIPPIPKP